MKCPCHSQKPYSECCAPYHRSLNAPTPLALMRSRYSAYALGNAEYIIKTTHPDHPDSSIPAPERRKQIKLFCRSSTFKDLEILESTDSTVTFKATLTHNGQDASFTEKSAFAQINDRWYYLGPLNLIKT
jgi:SEC-C motif domain protein